MNEQAVNQLNQQLSKGKRLVKGGTVHSCKKSVLPDYTNTMRIETRLNLNSRTNKLEKKLVVHSTPHKEE